MAGRHSKGGVPAEGVAARNRRQVVDVTEMSPREIRARMEYLQDRHVVQVEQACDDLAASLDRFHAGLVALRDRVVMKASAAAPVVAGGAAVVATTVVLVRVAGSRRR